jgi:UPF0755 protein
MKRPIRALIIIGGTVLALAIAGLGFVAWVNAMSAPADGIPQDGAVVVVEKGEGVSSLSKSLEERKVIRSAFAFQILAKVYGDELKAGTYYVEAGSGSADILTMLVQGRQVERKVTIPEGFTIRQVAELLEKKSFCKKADFLAACKDLTLIAKHGITADTVEGYLYPDTYRFPLEYPARDIAEKMVDTFFEKLAQNVPESAALSPRALHQAVVLASIVEREYRAKDEAPLIASVFLNRVAKRMPLESCATVVYVITEVKGRKHPNRVFYEDLEIDNPYNTYLYPGLPPGPIANPGMTAVSAALRPAKTDYLYFVLNAPGDDRHHFSATWREHSAAANAYVKALDQGK